MAPINRDVDEERLARIEQMLEDLRRQVSRLSDDHQQVRRDALVTHEKAAHARTDLQRTIATSRAQRRQRAARKNSGRT